MVEVLVVVLVLLELVLVVVLELELLLELLEPLELLAPPPFDWFAVQFSSASPEGWAGSVLRTSRS